MTKLKNSINIEKMTIYGCKRCEITSETNSYIKMFIECLNEVKIIKFGIIEFDNIKFDELLNLIYHNESFKDKNNSIADIIKKNPYLQSK